MYGDSGVMRKRAAQIREQATDIRAMADQLVAQTESIAWTGRAADAMRERIRDRAANLRDVAGAHDTAADSLERHLHRGGRAQGPDRRLPNARRTSSWPTPAPAWPRSRTPTTPTACDRAPDPEDETLTAFAPPPSGHKDWLTVNLPGL